MQVSASGVSKGPAGRALPPTDVEMTSGRAVFVEAETAQRPTVLGLIVSGRMRPDAGEVLIDGEPGARALRRRVALVDAPDVSEPHGDVRLEHVVAEELMFAGEPPRPLAARRELRALGFADHARTPMAELAPEVRVRVLCELALRRPGVEGIVLVSPDRHGGDPMGWWGIACELAERGNAVLVIAGLAARAAIDAHPDGWRTGEVTPLRGGTGAATGAATGAETGAASAGTEDAR
ncbi:hypothetical protein [Leucobacter sp. PH1c]|uniref:hypothetical protein n=1 Tax=Leucobacter sp. PH1c TaxID=1397278 RepID=UPI0004693FC3|nr:hypothetical protein [Leucobacter sp. PH1c]